MKGQVLIQVAASSVNPVDWKIIETGGGFGVFRFPHTIGFDIAGTVVECRTYTSNPLSKA